ncbi:glycosyl transferase family 1 [Meridianimaribacter sp. CL38]|nr:glycosyl transferase family 1 [Meridianimaribacter sp. CL38]
MKILIVNFSDIEGGAARASYRLHNSLLKEGVSSTMLVKTKKSDDYTVISPTSKIGKFTAKAQSIINPYPLLKYKEHDLFSPSFSPSFRIVKAINEINADIVHLHWINAGMLKIEDFSKIKAPIVWSLHDMWAFTGGCHYSKECERYKENCGKCIILKSNKENDLSRKIFNRKKKTFAKTNLTIIGLSKWLESCAKSSTLFRDKRVVNLPNPIDTNLFKQVEQKHARKLFNLPNDKKLILFGAMSATSDKRKGFDQLKKALKSINKECVELLIYGSSKPQNPENLGFKSHYLGRLYDDASLTAIYNAADVMIVPSLEENLSNVIMESLSCGTPVVGFDIGGNSDLIDHKENGYLAKPLDTNDLAKGIEWVLNNENYLGLKNKSRAKVLKNFDTTIVAKKYIQLYKSIN